MNEKTGRAGKKKAKPLSTKTNRPDRDRRVRQADRLARVLRVLELIQSRGRWTRRSIAEELNCSERTVYRDLDVLKFAGVPYYDEGDQHFLRVRPDYRFPAVSLNNDEVLGLSMANSITRAAGMDISPGAGPVARKLAAISSEATQELIDDAMRLVAVLDLKMADHSRHHEAIRTVQWALIRQKQISGLYESPYESAAVRLRLHPYRLCLIKNAWYVVARQSDETAPKTFRVARFKALRMLDDSAAVPEEFDLRKYFGNAWAVYRGESSHEVQLLFQSPASRIVTETVWHHTQRATVHKNGSVMISFVVDGLNELLRWLLSWAGQVQVLAPDELRELFVNTMRTSIEMNVGKMKA